MGKLSIIVLAGLTNGSVYGLLGLSLSITYSASRVINFAQGEFVMAAAMTAILFITTYSLPLAVSLVLVLVVVLVLGAMLDRCVYRPLLARGAPPLTIMIGTMAAAIVMTGTAQLLWGTEQQYVPAVFSLEPINAGPLTTNAQQLAIVVAFAVALAVVWVLLYRTQFGLCVRATGIDRRVALLMGIRAERVVRFGFLLSAVLSGVAGILVGPLLGGQVSMGLLLTVKGFMAAILGGLGSPFAAAAGGIAIGLMEALMAGYGTSLYAEPVIFLLMLFVLFVRPYGLLGDYEAERT